MRSYSLKNLIVNEAITRATQTRRIRAIGSSPCFLLFVCLSLLFVAGCKEIYVDANNNTAPWSGTQEHPYRTIQRAILDTTEGSVETIQIRSALYEENIELKRGTSLVPWYENEDPPIIRGLLPNSPTISAKGENYISGFVIEGGSHGVQFEMNDALGEKNTIYAHVVDCEILNVNTSSQDGPGHGIVVIAEMNSGRSIHDEKKVHLYFENNYIHDIAGDGIHMELYGSPMGQMTKLLDISDNVIMNTRNGISLENIGRPTPEEIVYDTLVAGEIKNNLIIYNNSNGIDIAASDYAQLSPIISYNTITQNSFSGIRMGCDYQVRPNINANIIANNDMYGYFEYTSGAKPWTMNNNLYYDNIVGNYYDHDTSRIIDTEAELDRQGLMSAQENLIGDPLFVDGIFYWKGDSHTHEPSQFFLSQNGSTSPAVDAGDSFASERGLALKTTCTDGLIDDAPIKTDVGKADIGFHYDTAHD